jgi:hypothetical protein
LQIILCWAVVYMLRRRRAISRGTIFWKEASNGWLGLYFGAFQIIEAAEYELNIFFYRFQHPLKTKQIYFPLEFDSELALRGGQMYL